MRRRRRRRRRPHQSQVGKNDRKEEEEGGTWHKREKEREEREKEEKERGERGIYRKDVTGCFRIVVAVILAPSCMVHFFPQQWMLLSANLSIQFAQVHLALFL